MRYRRKCTRPPRQVEITQTAIELERMRMTVAAYRAELAQLREEVGVRRLEVDKLLHEKVLLATELRQARTVIHFLQGTIA